MPCSVASAMETLVEFAVAHGLIAAEDRHYALNGLLDALRMDAPAEGGEVQPLPPTATPLLSVLCDEAVRRGIIEDTPTRRDLFSARLMGLFTAPPSVIAERFERIAREEGVERATSWFYELCRMNDYIRVDAIARNVRFFAPSEYGELEITINLSKPEKDPRDIAALLTKKSVEYPPCMLCLENTGYAGRIDFPARQTLRAIPLTLSGAPWHMQYSPYLYYNEHCIVFNDRHTPMAINRGTFERLLEFVTRFPHYFLGSNADLPIVGGSILNHDHFQGGRHHFPMEKAPAYAKATHPDFPQVDAELVAWPLTTLRLRAASPAPLCALAERVLACWRGYSDASLDILAHSGDTPHNTITPIARREGEGYVLDLVLRNNRTTPELPLGIFHPHPDLHHIKKENIGLIEVMGLFILPGRLQRELAALEEVLTGARTAESVRADEHLKAHAEWIESIAAQTGCALSPDAARETIRAELAKKCARVLHDAGVYKLDEAGKAGAKRFLQAAGFTL